MDIRQNRDQSYYLSVVNSHLHSPNIPQVSKVTNSPSSILNQLRSTRNESSPMNSSPVFHQHQLFLNGSQSESPLLTKSTSSSSIQPQ